MVKNVFREKTYPSSIANVAMHNILWLYPFTFLPFSIPVLDARGGECRNGTSLCITMNAHCMILTDFLTSFDLIVAAFLVVSEAIIIKTSGFSDFPGGLYGIFFSSCLMVFFSYRFFASVPFSWIPSFADTWSASKAAYDRVRRAGNK